MVFKGYAKKRNSLKRSQPFFAKPDTFPGFEFFCALLEEIKFICKVKKLWGAETLHRIEVKFKFNAALANQDPDHTTFAVFTHVVDQHSKLDYQTHFI